MSTRTRLDELLSELHEDERRLVEPILEQLKNPNVLLPILERFTELRETIEVLEDSELLAELKHAKDDVAAGQVTALEEL